MARHPRRLHPLPVPFTFAALALLATAAGGCAPRGTAPPPGPAPLGPEWKTTVQRGHPLVGRIWDVAGRRFVDERTLVDGLAGARHVVLGELHDNADHHAIQARLVAALAARGRSPVLALEMISADQDEKLAAALAAPGGPTPDGIAGAVAWDQSGWPAFALYRPIFEAGLPAGMPVRAASLPHPLVRRVVREGRDVLPADARALLDAAPPLGEKDLKELKEEMDESHCAEMPASMLAPMVLAQRARDAHMAARIAAAGERGSILIAGNQHAREDRGVPAYLPAADRASVATVAIAEVAKGWKTPARYAEAYGDPLPFDYVVFTPGFAREDPCAKLKEQLKKKRENAPAAPPTASPRSATSRSRRSRGRRRARGGRR